MTHMDDALDRPRERRGRNRAENPLTVLAPYRDERSPGVGHAPRATVKGPGPCAIPTLARRSNLI
jgi:hypothetical protein